MVCACRRLVTPIALALATIALALAGVGCATSPSWEPRPYIQLSHPDWAHDAVIYQINTRQFTQEGTLNAAAEHLPRLAALGVDILWLMPIHPIGEAQRKGTLGSPYAVQDYRAVNPDLGTLADMRAFVGVAHDLGMVVILDWVANHTAWDHAWVTEHPDWYSTDIAGAMQHPPGTDWTDVADLNFEAVGLRREMAEAMAFWVEDVGVDGFRCDVAGFVPLDFWEGVRARLTREKPVFMLAEWQTRDVHARAFDASYAWGWKEAMQDGLARQSAGPVRAYYADHANTWPAHAMRMHYTANHDQNTWDGTAREMYGEGLEMAMILSFTGEGIPLIYNGQEAGLNHRLAFFEKDEIVWREHPHGAFLERLIALKTEHSALWNGRWGAPLVSIENTMPDQVFSFIRQDKAGGVFVMANFTDQTLAFTLDRRASSVLEGTWRDAFSGEVMTLIGDGDGGGDGALRLDPWGYGVWVRVAGTASHTVD